METSGAAKVEDATFGCEHAALLLHLGPLKAHIRTADIFEVKFGKELFNFTFPGDERIVVSIIFLEI
ncbi:hypothetical protein ACS0TY_024992 [Phlomoides rotata]